MTVLSPSLIWNCSTRALSRPAETSRAILDTIRAYAPPNRYSGAASTDATCNPPRIRQLGRYILLAVMLTAGISGCSNRTDSREKRESATPQNTPPAGASAATKKESSTISLGPPPWIQTAAELDAGWIALFDGQTLFGWQTTSGSLWHVDTEENTLSAGEKTDAPLWTTAQLGAFSLSLEYQCDAQGLGSILIADVPTLKNPALDHYEIRIGSGDAQFPAGSLVARQPAERADETAPWNRLEVQVQPGKISVKHNARNVVDYTDPHPFKRSSIGLQCDRGVIHFRNIKLQPLDLKPIFNARDLTGWKTYPDMPSVFSVTKEGYLHVENGRGQLETEQQYGDFVLQFECITNAPNLNSGIFFRCIPGEQMNGYESQIHNGFKNGDRSQPVDCGTGGVFRRKDARRVVADDLKWFHETLIVDGPHVSTWVDGYQVTDWTDARAPDTNPRRGLRLEPGTIMIQGHDPTTNISFRNLRIIELPRDKTD